MYARSLQSLGGISSTFQSPRPWPPQAEGAERPFRIDGAVIATCRKEEGAKR
jgi:hypothetical protein